MRNQKYGQERERIKEEIAFTECPKIKIKKEKIPTLQNEQRQSTFNHRNTGPPNTTQELT